MSSRKYRVEQNNKVLGHFSGHTLEEACQKAVDNQSKYGNHFDITKPFYLFRGSNKYSCYLNKQEV